MGRKRDPKPRQITVTRYELPDGTRCKKGDHGASKITTRTDSYYLILPDGQGGKETIPLETTDESVAWHKVRDILQQRKEETLGILTDQSRQAARPIAEHLEEWLANVAVHVQPDRVKLLRTRVSNLIRQAKWERITDIRKSSCEIALAALRAEEKTGRGSAAAGKGRSAQTSNHYLAHARQFTAWLVAEKRLASDPLALARKQNTQTDRRHDRRCPDDLEIRVFFDHLAGKDPKCPPKVRREMSGPQRALGYMVAMYTGLRAGALRKLSRESFDLDSGDVKVPAKNDKARKKRLSVIPRWLCDKLRAWFDAGGSCWENFSARAPGETLQADLARARKGWIAQAQSDEERTRREQSTVCAYEIPSEDGPLYWDFHALRHYYMTAIASTDGISPATLQAMSGHSDPRLTLGTYSHGRRKDARAAVEQLPNLD